MPCWRSTLLLLLDDSEFADSLAFALESLQQSQQSLARVRAQVLNAEFAELLQQTVLNERRMRGLAVLVQPIV